MGKWLGDYPGDVWNYSSFLELCIYRLPQGRLSPVLSTALLVPDQVSKQQLALGLNPSLSHGSQFLQRVCSYKSSPSQGFT